MVLLTALRALDFDAAKALSKLVDGANRRYCELMAQLGLEGDGARKNPVLFIAAANAVHVRTGGDPR